MSRWTVAHIRVCFDVMVACQLTDPSLPLPESVFLSVTLCLNCVSFEYTQHFLKIISISFKGTICHGILYFTGFSVRIDKWMKECCSDLTQTAVWLNHKCHLYEMPSCICTTFLDHLFKCCKEIHIQCIEHVSIFLKEWFILLFSFGPVCWMELIY